MRPWIKRTFIGLFSATVLLGGLTACGHGHHGNWQMSDADAQKMRERMIDRVSRELTLDDAQKQRLGVLADKLREQRLALVGSTTDPRARVAGTRDRHDLRPRACAGAGRIEDERGADQEPRSHHRDGRLLRQPEA